jgi:hypothetical protein
MDANCFRISFQTRAVHPGVSVADDSIVYTTGTVTSPRDVRVGFVEQETGTSNP